MPRDPLVILAAADWQWRPSHPALWRRLRVAFLGCAWRVRCVGAAACHGVTPAVAVVRDVVAALAHAVQRDWGRVQCDVRDRAAGVIPSDWFRGRDPRLSRAGFDGMWPATGGWFVIAADGATLQVRLSPQWPVVMVE